MAKITPNRSTEAAVAIMRVPIETVQAFCLGRSLTSKLSQDLMLVNHLAASIAPRLRKTTHLLLSLNRLMRSPTVQKPLQGWCHLGRSSSWSRRNQW